MPALANRLWESMAMKRLLLLVSVLLLPATAPAQVKGAPTSGDAARLDGANVWTGQQRFQPSCGFNCGYPIISLYNDKGAVSPRNNAVIEVVGAPQIPGTEVNFDAFAYNGFIQYDAERYDIGGPNNSAVRAGETIGVYSFEPFDGISDSNTAEIVATATEDQSNAGGAHGTSLYIGYTPNAFGPRLRCAGITISNRGTGGVTVGYTKGCQSPPADMGQGTLNLAGALYADNGLLLADDAAHLRGMGGAGAPTVDNSGTVVSGSTDNRGEIAAGGAAAKRWTISWSHPWPTRPFCTATPLATGGGTVTVAPTAASLTVEFTNNFSGGFDWVCL